MYVASRGSRRSRGTIIAASLTAGNDVGSGLPSKKYLPFRQQQQQSSARTGDWVCPNCGNLCFEWRSSCFRCDSPKNVVTTAPGDKASNSNSNRNSVVVDTQRNTKKATAKRTKVQPASSASVSPNLMVVLREGDRTRDYSQAVAEVERRLAASSSKHSNTFFKTSLLSTMIQVYGKAGLFDKAIELFRKVSYSLSHLLSCSVPWLTFLLLANACLCAFPCLYVCVCPVSSVCLSSWAAKIPASRVARTHSHFQPLLAPPLELDRLAMR